MRWAAGRTPLFVTDFLAAVAADNPGATAPAPPTTGGWKRASPGPGTCPAGRTWAEAQLSQIFWSSAVLVQSGSLPAPAVTWLAGGNGPGSMSIDTIKGLIETEWIVERTSVGQALARLGTLSLVATQLSGWSAVVTPDQATDRFSVGDEPDRPNGFHVTVNPAVLSWFPGVDECLAAAGMLGLDVPDASGAGSAVERSTTGLPELGTELSADPQIDADGVATLAWNTGREADATGTVLTGTVTATATVDSAARLQFMECWSTTLQEVLGSAGLTAPAVALQMGDITKYLPDVIAAAQPLVGSASVAVTHHAGCTLDGSLPDGTWTGPITIATAGEGQVVSGTLTVQGSGTMTATVAAGTITGTFSMSMHETGEISTEQATAHDVDIDVAVDGTVGGTPAVPTLDGQATISGSMVVTVQGADYPAPIQVTSAASAPLQLQQIGCDTAVATFFPTYAADTSGSFDVSGQLTWTATRS